MLKVYKLQKVSVKLLKYSVEGNQLLGWLVFPLKSLSLVKEIWNLMK